MVINCVITNSKSWSTLSSWNFNFMPQGYVNGPLTFLNYILMIKAGINFKVKAVCGRLK